MKKNFLIISFLFISFCSFSQHSKPALELFEAALIKAKKENKNVLVIATGTWCGPCKYFKRGLYDAYNVQYFDRNYVIIQLHSSYYDKQKGIYNEGANKLIASYGGDTTAIPYWLIINPLKKKLHGQLDFSGDATFLKMFIAVLKKTSRLTNQELKMIYDRFRQIDTLIPED